MNSLTLVIVLSLIMFVGSSISGVLPVMIKASSRVMNLISILGAGLLVGVALIVIIPEGMITLNEAVAAHYEKKTLDPELQAIIVNTGKFTLDEVTQLHLSNNESVSEDMMSIYLGGSLVFGFLIMLLIDQIFHIIKDRFTSHSHNTSADEGAGLDEQLLKREDCKYIQNSIQSNRGDCVKIKRTKSMKTQSNNDFTDKKLTDALGNVYVKHDHGEYAMLGDDQEEEHSHEHAHEHFHGDKGTLIISTLGLVVHSIADSVALGSTCYASQGKNTSLPIIIFFALILHKCPAAIGLTTFLRHEGLKFREIIIHLG